MNRIGRDGDAFVAWARDHAPEVHRFLRRRAGSTAVADRLLAQTFERAAGELPARDAPADTAWLLGVAAEEVDGEPPAEEPILAAMGSLRRRSRRTLGLAAFGELTTEEVARVTGRSPATVAVAVDRAVAAVAGHTGEEPASVRAAIDRLAAAPVEPVTDDVLDDLERRLRPFHAAQGPTADPAPGRTSRRRVAALAAMAVIGVALFVVLLVRGGPTTVEIVEVESARVELPDGTEVEAEDGLRVPPGTVITTEEDGFARFSFDEIGPGETATVFEGRIER